MRPALDDLEGLTAPSPAWFRAAFEVPRASAFVDVEGTSIHYLRWGSPSAPPVLMTHGFLAHARAFAFVAPLLAHRFHVVAFDLSGMGDSGTRSTYADRSGEAMAVAEHAGLLEHSRPPIFVTHSYGGTVAIRALERWPERFGGLIVCDLMMKSPAQLEAYLGRDDIARLPPSRAKANKTYPDLPTAMGRFRLAPSQPCENAYLMEYMARHSVRAVEGGWSWKFDPAILGHRNGASWWTQIPQRFVDLDVPKAIIHGRRSVLFDDESAAYLRSLGKDPLPIVGVVDAHHHLMLDQPLAFVAALEALLVGGFDGERGRR